MKNWKHSPKNLHVAKYVDCYWFLQKEQGDVCNNHPKLNPDPSAHLIITSMRQQYKYDQGPISQKGIGNHWIFPHRKTFVLNHSAPFLVIGIKFRVGALHALEVGLPQTELDKVECVDINKLTSMDSFHTERLIANAADFPQKTCDMLDTILSPWLSKSQEDKHIKLVRYILPLLSNTPITRIGAVLNRSQRTIERSFLNVTGLTLKQCHTMIRFEEILNYLYKLDDEDINWVDISTKFEFSDQPHLIRHMKNTIGQTPGEYARQRDLTIDIYGDFEF